jgi:lipopolysaccharide/colanic/teichoic acid biosynthesis glycosyltransferase
MVKFRTMCQGADGMLVTGAAAGNVVMFKLTDDPRVTRVGKVLRRSSLDELPQLFNVLGGSMSFVGPRPALPSEVAKWDAHAARRLDVLPGITGAWQVGGRSDLSWTQSIALDIDYVDRWTLASDLRIILRTVPAVLRAKGAY